MKISLFIINHDYQLIQNTLTDKQLYSAYKYVQNRRQNTWWNKHVSWTGEFGIIYEGILGQVLRSS